MQELVACLIAAGFVLNDMLTPTSKPLGCQFRLALVFSESGKCS